MTLSHPTERAVVRLLRTADAICDRLYTQRFNPLYQTGTIVVVLYVVLLVTGVWLTLFYRVGSPWESVARVTADPWTGNWVRGVHRYASDGAVVATLAHAFRMFAQGRSWGPRALAWTSGCLLLLATFACGWTGYVMVWDTFGLYLAQEGARMLDLIPLLSEPTSRAFTGEQPLPMAFFFLNLFAHIGIPLAIGAALWLHLKRVARPALLPPRPLMWTVAAILTGAALVRPLVMAPKADPLVLPESIPADLFFAFWIPLVQAIGPGNTVLVATAAGLMLLAVPRFTAPRLRREVSSVDPELCVGCNQCALDCPYGAITMIEREDRRLPLLAEVDPSLCVSCGICSGSCGPMGVGPPGRTGRDQMARVRQFLADPSRRKGELVVICCDHGAAASSRAIASAGGVPYPIDCAGNLHSSVIELMLRSGAGGVLLLACPPRDCWHREGPKWLVERVYHGREAELQARVDRARVRVANVNGGDSGHVVALVRRFAADLTMIDRPAVEPGAMKDAECAFAAEGEQ